MKEITNKMVETFPVSKGNYQTLSGEASDRSRAPPDSPKMFMASERLIARLNL